MIFIGVGDIPRTKMISPLSRGLTEVRMQKVDLVVGVISVVLLVFPFWLARKR